MCLLELLSMPGFQLAEGPSVSGLGTGRALQQLPVSVGCPTLGCRLGFSSSGMASGHRDRLKCLVIPCTVTGVPGLPLLAAWACGDTGRC